MKIPRPFSRQVNPSALEHAMSAALTDAQIAGRRVSGEPHLTDALAVLDEATRRVTHYDATPTPRDVAHLRQAVNAALSRVPSSTAGMLDSQRDAVTQVRDCLERARRAVVQYQSAFDKGAGVRR